MIPYILPIVFSSFLCYVKIGKGSLQIGNSHPIRSSSFALPSFFFSLFLLLSFRHETIGRDLVVYKQYFSQYSHMSLIALGSAELEPLYGLLNWIIGQFTNSFQFFLVVVAAICVLPIAQLYCENRKYSLLIILLFVNMPTFVMLFSGLRQAIAISIGVIAYKYAIKNRLCPFLLSVLVAMGFHKSAFVLLPIFWVCHIQIKRSHFFILIPVFIALFIFRFSIFSFLVKLIPEYAEKYSNGIDVSTAFSMLILFALLAAFSYIISDEKRLNTEALGLRNILLICFGLQCFASVHGLAMRFNYYYIIFIPIALAKSIETIREEYRQVASLGYYVMCAFFAIYFVYASYVSLTSGSRDLDTIPYIPFWKG